MKSVEYGYSSRDDDGIDVGVAMDGRGQIVEIHETSKAELWSRIRRVDQAALREQGEKTLVGPGTQPCCALSDSGLIVLVYRAPGDALHCRVGDLDVSRIVWRGEPQACGVGHDPSVAVDHDGRVVMAYQVGNDLEVRVGRIDGAKVTWHGDAVRRGQGRTPAVALNASGVVVTRYVAITPTTLCSCVGRLQDDGTSITWGQQEPGVTGTQPAIALTSDGLVLSVYRAEDPQKLFQQVGRVTREDLILWGPAVELDAGALPALGCNDVTSIQVHRSAGEERLWFSTSLIMDRGSWMHDAYGEIQGRTLRGLAMPASHDAGMYTSAIPQDPFFRWAQTQDRDVLRQLEAGVRYFDLRPKWVVNGVLVYHGEVLGPSLAAVLEDVKLFIEEGHQELIILKLSHFSDFDAARFNLMVDEIDRKLGSWLLPFTPADASGKALILGDMTMSDLIDGTARVLVVCDGPFAIEAARRGIFVYRGYDSPDVSAANLVVLDKFSNTESYSLMAASQIGHYLTYNGVCTRNATRAVDLFLLSWTLTPQPPSLEHPEPPTPKELCREPNTKLALDVAGLSVPNQYGQMLNLTYVDFCEYARGTDVCMYLNRLVPGATPRQ